MHIYILACLGVGIEVHSLAAQETALQLFLTDSSEVLPDLGRKHRWAATYRSQSFCMDALKSWRIQMLRQGYLLASIDSTHLESDTLQAWLYIGGIYQYAAVRYSKAAELLDQQTGTGLQQKLVGSVDPIELGNAISIWLNYLENHGYPFAWVRWDSLEILPEGMSGHLNLEKGPFILWDDVLIEGDARVSLKFITQYLGINPGSYYDESIARAIRTKLQALPYLRLTAPAEILFQLDMARLQLKLQDRKASQFDALIGFLPNNDITGRLLITGEANLLLQNALGRGELFRLNWRKLQAQTQSLEVEAAIPYLFGTPFGMEGDLRLFKKDTTFLDVEYQPAVGYYWNGWNVLKLFFSNRISNVLSIDTSFVLRNRQLPDVQSLRRSLAGVELRLDNLNDRWNPTKGRRIQLQTGAGIRRILPEVVISNLLDPERLNETFQFLYDSIELRSVQFRFEGDIRQYHTFKRRHTFLGQVRVGSIPRQTVLINEMYRLGGLRRLRGFDEESIFVSSFVLGTFEYRFQLGGSSFFQLFADVAWTEQRTLQRQLRDRPIGFGTGLQFETRAGIFSLAYAYGIRKAETLDLRTAKVHFGYINYF